MEFGSQWRRILTRAWSSRLMMVAMILSGLEAAIPFVHEIGLPIHKGTFAVLAFLVTGLALGARLLVQKDLEVCPQCKKRRSDDEQ